VGRGFTTYVVDLPGHGRSGQPAGFEQWSGIRYVDALEALLQQTGPALVLTHSMGGRIGWKLAERVPELLVGLFAVAPAPPPNLIPRNEPFPEDAPFRQQPDMMWAAVANTPTFPQDAWEQFLATSVPESARAVNEGRNAAGPELYVSATIFRDIPAAALAFDLDVSDPPVVVQRSTDYFGIPYIQADRDWGLSGHGHLAMVEYGNLDVAEPIADWLEQTALEYTTRP